MELDGKLRKRLASMANRILENLAPDMLDDVVQDALINVWKSKQDPADHPSGWLYSIVRNVAFDKMRKLATRRKYEACSLDQEAYDEDRQRRDLHETGGINGDFSKEDVFVDYELVGFLLAEVRKLPTIYREQIVLNFYGYTYDDAADVLGIAKGTVKSRLHRARRCMKRVYERSEFAC
jgi:RNA polymerase sigma-70 factor (ECF subfamily)